MKDRQVVLHINQEIDITNLAALDAIQSVTQIDASREQGLMIDFIKGTWNLDVFTAGEGPILVGMSTGLASAALVEECIEADPQQKEDAVAMEQTNRKVAPQAVLTGNDDAMAPSQLYYRNMYFPWREIPEGKGLELFAYNLKTVLTSAALVRFTGVVVGEWLRD